MTDCIHGFPENECGDCSGAGERRGRATAGAGSDGYSFALIYAPSFRTDTFLHLNRQGERWKIRW